MLLQMEDSPVTTVESVLMEMRNGGGAVNPTSEEADLEREALDADGEPPLQQPGTSLSSTFDIFV